MARHKIIKYIDKRPIYFPRLAFYPGGLTLPNESNEIKVTEKEWKHLKNEKNGNNLCYQEVKPERKAKVEPEIKED